ncbi:SsrA-binding protein SmpB [Rhizobium sp. BK176]|uniref:SsrA-binding protein SmpB n=1 Tax=Rhizobium sp. BK176 TaxID=2587071 RepID=UPI0021683BB1|nr:SsrA-binding protein SmpB [Rhizobium sp. BK176]MCS4088841.1 SsrA-binding protein [Rhizobium sp. BK176]
MADAENKKTVVAENRRARFDYDIIETIQAGIVLTGTEVKSLRNNKVTIGESYASVEGGELWLINSHVPEFLQANRFNHEPRRHRKLLVKRREIDKLQRSISREGMTVVPLKLYFEKGRAKLDIAIAKGRKAHDKRAAVKERDWNRDKARLI